MQTTFDELIVTPASIGPDELRQLVALVNAAFRRHAWLFPVARTSDATFGDEVAGKELLLLRAAGGPPRAMSAFEAVGDALRFGMAVVAPELQGGGLGRRLVAALERRARALGLRAVELETVREIGNEDYYRRLGYVRCAAEARPAGVWGALRPFTLVRMRKPL